MRRAAGLFILICGCRFGFEDHATARDARPDALPPICTQAFGAPALIPGINTTDNDYNPVVTTDGLELFFHSSRAGLGGSDIWTARRTSPTLPFGTPTIAGVSSSSDEGGASLTADGMTMFFSS